MGTAAAKIVGIAVSLAIVASGAAIIVGQVNATGGTAQPIAPVAAQAAPVIRDGESLPIAEAVSRITIGKTTRDELAKLLGEPNRYLWGDQTFTVAQLPAQYVMQYDGVSFMMGESIVEEIRFEGLGPYKFRDKIGFGSPLADVLALLGQPRKTVEGQAIMFEEGVLYRKCKRMNMFDGYYQRSDQGVRLFLANDRVIAIYLTRTIAEADNPAAAASTFTSDKTDKLQWGRSMREDVIKAMGEPAKYIWGPKTFTPDTLPKEVYIMQYPGDDQVVIRQGLIDEIRVHRTGPFQFKGLKVGSPLADVLRIVGQPTATLDGVPNRFEDGVLYKNIDKRPGRGYYQRTEVGVRLFLVDDAVGALYLIRPRK